MILLAVAHLAHLAVAQHARIMDDCITYVIPPEPKRPPDDSWPLHTLRAWPPYEAALAPGQIVYLRGSRAKVPIARVVSADGPDDLLVTPISDSGPQAGTVRSVPRRKAEMMRGRDGKKRALLLCSDTDSFRSLARSQVGTEDIVLEIGCSYGEATVALAKRARSVLAVDIAREPLDRAAAHCAHRTNVRFEPLDVLNQAAQLASMAEEEGVDVVFVDINGNRASAAIAPLVRIVQERLRPQLTVVKSRELFKAAGRHRDECLERSGEESAAEAESASEGHSAADGADGSALPDGSRFWERVWAEAAEREGSIPLRSRISSSGEPDVWFRRDYQQPAPPAAAPAGRPTSLEL